MPNSTDRGSDADELDADDELIGKELNLWDGSPGSEATSPTNSESTVSTSGSVSSSSASISSMSFASIFGTGQSGEAIPACFIPLDRNECVYPDSFYALFDVERDPKEFLKHFDDLSWLCALCGWNCR